jgi:thiol:disulfide interchange protein
VKRILIILAVIAAFLGSFGSLSAKRLEKPREKFASDSSVLTLSVDPKAEIMQGKTFQAKVHFKIGKGWHIYSSKSSPDAGFPMIMGIPKELDNTYQLINISETGKTVSHYDSAMEGTTVSHYQDFDAIVTIKVKPTASIAKSPFYLLIDYQTCNESNCIPPNTYAVPMTFLGGKPLELTIKKNDGKEDTSTAVIQQPIDTTHPAVAETPKTSTPSADPSSVNATSADDLNKLADDSIWKFIFAAVGFGLLALVTPCVFPMIPITVSFFTKRNQGSKKHAVKDAIFYAAGIIGTFVALGFLLALVMGPAGINKFAANPIVNAFIAVVFIAFALNLFGLFELGVPSSMLTNLHMKAHNHENKIFSVILMGFVFSLTSFTCTVPFVGTLMVSFSKGAWFVPLIGMTVFASVFALPFFLLALFPSAMKALPKSGGWLNSVKVVMGFLEIAAALKFLSNIDLVYKWGFFTRDLVLAAWMALMIITTLYLLGRFHLPHDTPSEHIGPLRAVFAVVFLTFSIYLYTGLGGKALGELDGYLPPDIYSHSESAAMGASLGSKQTSGESNDLRWHARYTDALAEAKKTGKNVFIDFTGYQCTNCRAMEATIFKEPQVKNLFKDFVLARLYADDGSPLNDSNRTMEEQRFNTIAQPYYVIISPDDKPLATFPGFTRDLNAFVSFLKGPGTIQ